MSVRKARQGYKLVKSLFGKYEEIPEDWDFQPLIKIIIKKKKVLEPFEYPNQEFELYSIPAYHEKGEPEIQFGKDIHSTKLIVENDTVLFGKINPDLPKIWYVNSESKLQKVASTEFIPLKANSNSTSKFIYYLSWSKYLLGKYKSITSGTTPSRERIEPKLFFNLHVPLPPIPEQQKITSILSNVDSLINQTQKIIEQTHRLKKGLMQKLLTRGIRHTKFKKVKDFFKREFEIPEEWDYPKFSTVVKINPNTKVTSLKIKYVPMDAIDTENSQIKYFEDRDFESNSNLPKFQENDVLFARITPSTENGKTALVENFKGVGIASSELTVLRPGPKVIPRYLFYFVKSYRIRQFAISQMMGTTNRQRVPDYVFKKDLNFELPLLDEQEKITRIIFEIDFKTQKQQEYKSKLEALKKGLMQKLLTGQIRVNA